MISQAKMAEIARQSEEAEKYARRYGQVIVERDMLEEALEAAANVLERIPWVADPDGTLIENAVDVFARLRVMLPRKVQEEEEDIDTSDNEEVAQ